MTNETFNLLSAMEYNYNEYARYVARLPYMHIQHSLEMIILTSEKIPSWNVVLRTQLSSQNVAKPVSRIE